MYDDDDLQNKTLEELREIAKNRGVYSLVASQLEAKTFLIMTFYRLALYSSRSKQLRYLLTNDNMTNEEWGLHLEFMWAPLTLTGEN